MPRTKIKSRFCEGNSPRRAEEKGGGRFFLLTSILAAITVGFAAVRGLWRK